jgi:hypothetical protein
MCNNGFKLCLAVLMILYDYVNKEYHHYNIGRNMGKWKCLWCSKVLEGESFMDLVEATMKVEGGQHVHGWENITLVEEEILLPENKLLA